MHRMSTCDLTMPSIIKKEVVERAEESSPQKYGREKLAVTQDIIVNAEVGAEMSV
jgi:hypothetical protein